MKKLTSLLLALLLCISLVACGSVKDADISSSTESTKAESTKQPDSPPAEGTSKPLLYRVTDDDGSTVWLFGSIHVGKESYYPLPDYVIEAYEGADSLAVEIDMKAFSEDLTAQMKALSLLVDRSGTKIDTKLDKELYDDAISILKDFGLYNSMLDLYVPVMWSMLIDNALYDKMGLRTDLGIDNYMLELAYEDGKTVLDVEGADAQYSMFAGFSEELQIKLLKDSVEAYNAYVDGDTEVADELSKLLELWESGNEEAFEEALREEYEPESEEDGLLYAEYEKAVVTDRNTAMADFAEDALASGDEVFICVGAAHVVGDGAMAELLAERGYTVELIK